MHIEAPVMNGLLASEATEEVKARAPLAMVSAWAD
jgi:hypothetical protein